MSSVSNQELKISVDLDVWEWIDSHKDKSLCTIKFCSSVVKARSFCRKHYLRWRKSGNPHIVFGKVVPCAPPGYKACMVCLDIVSEDLCMVRQNRCNVCLLSLTKKWKSENPELVREQNKKYREKNPDQWSKWASSNPESLKRIRARRKARVRGALDTDPICLSDLVAIHGWSCYLCGDETFEKKRKGFPKYDPKQANMEHMTPLSRGGSHTYENLRVSCAQCNFRKRDLTVEEYRIKLGE